ncbi:FABP family protein [Cnuibacter sp. UC19_7]|uniref:FABP family protein n=1 Tax=Cnuibacter sp. UC19_7 TaxID=3350166 RepID=UPI00366C8975
MIEIPTGLPAELVPLSWLLGVWEGTGVIDYVVGEEHVTHEFGQRVSFSHDGLPYLNYSSFAWLLPTQPKADAAEPEEGDADAADPTPSIETMPLTAESGYWRLSRTALEGDPGPGMLPGVGARPFTTAQSVEALRTSGGDFEVEASILHPTGVSELYLGRVAGPRIDLATDAVLRSATAKEYSAATRMYGLVEGHLLWAWDIAALGQSIRTHASARLAKVD